MPKFSPNVPKGGRNGLQREADWPSEPSEIDKNGDSCATFLLGCLKVLTVPTFAVLFGYFAILGPHCPCFFVLFVGFIFGTIVGWFWSRFGSHLAPFWMASSATSPDFARNARPHENLVNSSQIEGRAAAKTIKSY